MEKLESLYLQEIEKQYIIILSTKSYKSKPKGATNLFVIDERKVQYSEIKRCRCNPRLRLFKCKEELKFTPYYGEENYYCLKLDDGLYYAVEGAMPNALHGNPNNQDPPPRGGAYAIDERTGSEYEMDNYEPLRSEYLKAAKNHADTHPDAPVVAILDTGIDLNYLRENGKINFPLHYYNNHPCGLCPNLCYICNCDCSTGIYGWDFIRENPHTSFPENPFDDDRRHKHGTRIAKIIANVSENNVRIMPLKVSNYKNELEFFDIFCAFEYILNYNKGSSEHDKVKFINASWGYYGKAYGIFTSYIERLRDESIRFICAAGNESDFNSGNQEIGVDMERYPTMYSKVYKNVYTATTIEQIADGTYKAVEKYSNEYVEVGVEGKSCIILKDTVQLTVNGTFDDSLIPSADFIKGSSYATAFLTGYLVKTSANDYKNPGSLGNDMTDLKPLVRNASYLIKNNLVEP